MKKKISQSPDKLSNIAKMSENNPEDFFSPFNKEPDDNLEYDLRTTDWILEKVRNSEKYATELYAALCNNVFIKNEKQWSCSWRHAGGVLADMCEEGDYMSFYCSGDEGSISEEIQKDLLILGWKLFLHHEG